MDLIAGMLMGAGLMLAVLVVLSAVMMGRKRVPMPESADEAGERLAAELRLLELALEAKAIDQMKVERESA